MRKCSVLFPAHSHLPSTDSARVSCPSLLVQWKEFGVTQRSHVLDASKCGGVVVVLGLNATTPQRRAPLQDLPWLPFFWSTTWLQNKTERYVRGLAQHLFHHWPKMPVYIFAPLHAPPRADKSMPRKIHHAEIPHGARLVTLLGADSPKLPAIQLETASTWLCDGDSDSRPAHLRLAQWTSRE